MTCPIIVDSLEIEMTYLQTDNVMMIDVMALFKLLKSLLFNHIMGEVQ